MKNIFKFSSYLLAFFFISLVSNASEKDKICPFELISFTAETISDSLNNKLIVNLEWKTASELNTDKFVVERRPLPIITFYQDDEFVPIGERDAAGTSVIEQKYNFSDTLILYEGYFEYRIKGIDKDNSYAFSDVIISGSLSGIFEPFNNSPLIEKIYPNPSNGLFNILLNINCLGVSMMTFLNSQGEILKSISLKSYNELINIDLNDFPSGEYYINVSRGTNFEIKKIIIIK